MPSCPILVVIHRKYRRRARPSRVEKLTVLSVIAKQQCAELLFAPSRLGPANDDNPSRLKHLDLVPATRQRFRRLNTKRGRWRTTNMISVHCAGA
jgi:hypothetical protein